MPKYTILNKFDIFNFCVWILFVIILLNFHLEVWNLNVQYA